MTREEAKKKIANAYKNAFSKEPDQTVQIIINLSAERIAKGEDFKWEISSGFEKLVFLPVAKET